jgi:hypothetical protein
MARAAIQQLPPRLRLRTGLSRTKKSGGTGQDNQSGNSLVEAEQSRDQLRHSTRSAHRKHQAGSIRARIHILAADCLRPRSALNRIMGDPSAAWRARNKNLNLRAARNGSAAAQSGTPRRGPNPDVAQRCGGMLPGRYTPAHVR